VTAPAEARPLALTMGEPAGIGGEIALQAWRRRREGVPPFFCLDDPERLATLARRVGLATPIVEIREPEEAAASFDRALPVLAVRLAGPVEPGRPDPAAAPAVIASIERAVDLVRARRVGAVVTNPIHKETLLGAGFEHPGHTEYLGALAGLAAAPVMMLACPELRVVPVTVHLPLRQAVRQLKRSRIVHCGRVADAALRRWFGIARPRIAVAGLNPHAGEGGHLGREDVDIVAPAVADLVRAGVGAFGPLAADSLFHPGARATYDAVLCMYHDQALIPIKTIDFERGVNVTLGLPFVRTSPDHGTAFDIAGAGRANPASLMAALSLAAEMARVEARIAAPVG
jgi:4-hydroxythreonine-4-phosphate dehydrogenase